MPVASCCAGHAGWSSGSSSECFLKNGKAGYYFRKMYESKFRKAVME